MGKFYFSIIIIFEAAVESVSAQVSTAIKAKRLIYQMLTNSEIHVHIFKILLFAEFNAYKIVCKAFSRVLSDFC